MRGIAHVLGIAGAVLGWLLVASVPIDAQRRLTAEGRGGIVIPAGDLSDLARAGATFGGGVAFHLTPEFAIRGDFDASFMEGNTLASGREAPGVNLYHYTGGVEFALVQPRAGGRPVTLATNVGVGATDFEVEAFITSREPHRGESFIVSERYFTANAGLKLGYELGRNVGVLLGGQGFVTFADEKDTAVLRFLDENDARSLGTVWSFPITAGVKIRL